MTTYEKIKDLCEKQGFAISSIGQKIQGRKYLDYQSTRHPLQGGKMDLFHVLIIDSMSSLYGNTK